MNNDQTKTSEVNFDTIGKMLCGYILTKDQKEEVKQFNKEFDEAAAAKGELGNDLNRI